MELELGSGSALLQTLTPSMSSHPLVPPSEMVGGPFPVSQSCCTLPALHQSTDQEPPVMGWGKARQSQKLWHRELRSSAKARLLLYPGLPFGLNPSKYASFLQHLTGGGAVAKTDLHTATVFMAPAGPWALWLLAEEVWQIRFFSTNFALDRPSLKFYLYFLLVVWLWAIYWTSLSFTFFVYKIRW